MWENRRQGEPLEKESEGRQRSQQLLTFASMVNFSGRKTLLGRIRCWLLLL